MDMIDRHDSVFNVDSHLFGNLTDNVSDTDFEVSMQNLVSIFRSPHNMGDC